MTLILLIATRLGWGFFEAGLRVRDRARGTGSTDNDRGTRELAGGLAVAAIVLAIALEVTTGEHSPLRIPGAGLDGWPAIAALVVTWLGLMVRVWAVATLGSLVPHHSRGRHRPGRRLARPLPAGPPSVVHRHPPHPDRIRPGRRQLAGAGPLCGPARAGPGAADPGRGSRTEPRAGRPVPRLPASHQAPRPRLVVTVGRGYDRPGLAGQGPTVRKLSEPRWEAYFAVVYAATVAIVEAGPLTVPARIIATAALALMVPWYLYAGRPLMRPAWYLFTGGPQARLSEVQRQRAATPVRGQAGRRR